MDLCAMNACELTASVTALANTLACKLSEDEINMLGTVLTQLGDTLLTIVAHQAICRNACNGEK